MARILLLFISFLALRLYASSQSFEIKEGQFVLNGKPMRIYGGEMHYPRIPREYWQHRIQMAKAMGCNTLSIYVFWNYHETAPGVWDWKSDNHDLRAFVELAKAEGICIILRPGPYVCAEWDYGGLPYWLMNVPDMKVRSDNQPFLDSSRVYLQEVFRQVDGLFVEQGGNIIMTQVENEFGFFAFDTHMKRSERTAYKDKLTAIFRKVGFSHTLFTCDGGVVPVVNFARLGQIKGLFPGTNDSKFLGVARHTVHRFYDKRGPYYIPEEYAGWFTHWGDAHVFHRDVEKYKKHIEQLLKTDFSFCYYMVHGGTNFGFTNGTNHRHQNDAWPVITSYDYSAPIDEAGNATPLYDSLRAVYQRHTGAKLPDIPAPIATMAIDSIRLMPYAFYDVTRQYAMTVTGDTPTFEQLGHSGGYLLYQKYPASAGRIRLSTAGIGDYALIYVGDSLAATIDRNTRTESLPGSISLDIPAHKALDILVENTGHVNFGKRLWDNRKGFREGISIDGKYESNPGVMKLDEMPEYKGSSSYHPHQPVYYKGTFDISQTADTYLDMRGFGKGVVFVNGHNLGRYWEIGPQFSLYLPGVWLKKGLNEIVIFDQLNHRHMHSISATERPVNR